MSGSKFLPVEKQFWSKVNKTDTCWLWTGTIGSKGYGNFSIDGKKFSAHRLAWEFLVGPISTGLFVLHFCDNRVCVNPSHLFIGTQQDNLDDMSKKHRGTSKLTDEQVREIRSSNLSQRKIAEQYGLGHPTVGKIRRCQTHKFVA